MDNLEILDKIIKSKDPITIEKFIKISLYSKNGYYKNQNVLGKKGDFITSPEISQLFGEIIGLYILDYWTKKINKSFNLIELGPGLGHLLQDILRITKKFKKFNNSMQIKLIETNIVNKKIQKNNLFLSKYFANEIDKKIKWSSKFEIDDQNPILIIANEFFDCFPIRQFIKKENQWYEKMINFNKKKEKIEIINKKIINNTIIKKLRNYKSIDILEYSPSREKYFSRICKHIKKAGGMLIAIDYGYFEKPVNFTLQTVYNNKKSHILDNIGSQDITSLVDFKSLITIAYKNKVKVDLFTSQREFFLRYGIIEREKIITSSSNHLEKKIIREGLDRIIDNKQMGSFKVLIISK